MSISLGQPTKYPYVSFESVFFALSPSPTLIAEHIDKTITVDSIRITNNNSEDQVYVSCYVVKETGVVYLANKHQILVNEFSELLPESVLYLSQNEQLYAFIEFSESDVSLSSSFRVLHNQVEQ